jgi:hypothetical protein
MTRLASSDRRCLRLGIRLERITPGHPEQNGRHERMHLTLKAAAPWPAAANVLQQQDRATTVQVSMFVRADSAEQCDHPLPARH